MNEFGHDTFATIKTFLNGELWDTIVNDALNENDPDSVELMDNIMIRMQSAEYFLKTDNINRHERELHELANIIEQYN